MKKLFAIFTNGKNRKAKQIPETATIIPRVDHNISRQLISESALKVLYRLKKEGYAAFLVGGGVRDLLLGREPKDFDIVTNAKPEQIRRCFVNARIIGKRFRLVHVIFKSEVIEVSTFRAAETSKKYSVRTNEGMILHDNRYGSFAEDAIRRDFTVNALYYNIADFSVVDCHHGMADIQQGLIRMIGDPESRYREDPVRILRAIRFTAKLGFRIEPATEKPIATLGSLLGNVPPARLFTEYMKLFFSGYAHECYKLLHHYDLLHYLMPHAREIVDSENYNLIEKYIAEIMQQVDERIASGKSASPSFFLSAVLWPLVAYGLQQNQAIVHPNIKLLQVADDVLRQQLNLIAFPGHNLTSAREIWFIAQNLLFRKRSKVLRMVEHSRFKAAVDLLELRSILEPALFEHVEWWRAFYNATEEERLTLQKQLPHEKRKARRKKKQLGKVDFDYNN